MLALDLIYLWADLDLALIWLATVGDFFAAGLPLRVLFGDGGRFLAALVAEEPFFAVVLDLVAVLRAGADLDFESFSFFFISSFSLAFLIARVVFSAADE